MRLDPERVYGGFLPRGRGGITSILASSCHLYRPHRRAGGPVVRRRKTPALFLCCEHRPDRLSPLPAYPILSSGTPWPDRTGAMHPSSSPIHRRLLECLSVPGRWCCVTPYPRSRPGRSGPGPSALSTQRRGRRILRTSPVGHSRKLNFCFAEF